MVVHIRWPICLIHIQCYVFLELLCSMLFPLVYQCSQYLETSPTDAGMHNLFVF